MSKVDIALKFEDLYDIPFTFMYVTQPHSTPNRLAGMLTNLVYVCSLIYSEQRVDLLVEGRSG